MKMGSRRIIILCVDHDDDVGRKTGIKTPIIGEDSIREAAIRLLMADPSEADANTMFEALKILNDLRGKSQDEEYEAAVIAGSMAGGVESDRKIAEEIENIVKNFKADAAILVSDGYSDQVVAPIIQSFVPIISVRRFAVKHSEALETTWFILLTYLKTVLSDKRYTRWFLGLPGIIIVVFTTFFLLSMIYPAIPFLTYAQIVTLLILGFALLVRGFGIDEVVTQAIQTVSRNPSILLNITSVIVFVSFIIIGVIQASGRIMRLYPPEQLSDINFLLSHLNELSYTFVDESTIYFAIGLSLFIIGRAAYFFITRDERFWGSIPSITTTFMLAEAVRKAVYMIIRLPESFFDPHIMQLIIWILLSIASIAGVTVLTHKLKARYGHLLAGR
jgi:putative membrane protein